MLWLYIIGAIIVFFGAVVLVGAPYVPSHRRDIRKLFEEFIPISEEDTILDIGSGDGIVLREASRRGAKAVGYEIHPLFVVLAKVLSWRDSKVQVRWVNAWVTPFPDAVTLVYAFAVGRDGKKLARTVQREATRLRRPLRLVCYGNALAGYKVEHTFGAYYLYTFQPLHQK
jgi:hypothetical protein